MKIIYKIVEKIDDRTFYRMLTVLMSFFILAGIFGTLIVELNYQQKMNELQKMEVDELDEVMELRQELWQLDSDLKEFETPSEFKSLGKFTSTAYCSCSKCCGKWANGITASGTYCTEGITVAVDPEVIPLGTELYVKFADGLLHPCIAEDTGSAIKGNRIDIYMCEHDAALEYGVQEVEVFIEVD